MENKPITRKQKRQQERVSEEAKQAYEQLTKKFLDFFIFSDSPTEETIVAKMDELDRKWKVYCHQKKLNKEVYPIVNSYMEGVIKQYSEMDKIKELQKSDDGIPS